MLRLPVLRSAAFALNKRPLLALKSYRALSNESSSNSNPSTSIEKEPSIQEGNKAEEKKNTSEKDIATLLKEKDEQIAELKDSYRRALAEMENIRTRTRKEVEQTAQFATQKFAKDLLVVADTLTLALGSVPQAIREDKVNHQHVHDLYSGVTLIENELLNTFKRHGLEKQEPLNQTFDPNIHEALYQAFIPGKTPGSIISVEKAGYTLHGRVIRPAKVGVAKEN